MEKQIGQKLRDIRVNQGLKPMNVASQLKIDESTLYKIENGTNKSWGKYLFVLLDHYKKPVEEFFKEIEGKNFIQHQENNDNAIGIGQVNGGTINYSDKPIVKSLLNQKDKTIELLKDRIAHLEAELAKVYAKI
ncbi:MAG: helix-turn-helix transcriptional regulator [Chitinophagales bacterium]|jgi:transcriptional regulator with XRE-family HTH domain|nr:helix-turn-helix transcriptional regulator [Sphingobacteriales bacterium]